MYIKDITERYKIIDSSKFLTLIKFLASNIGSVTNPTKLEHTFKSELKQTYNCSTIDTHINYLKDAFIIDKCDRYDVKGKQYIGTNNKYYFQDLRIRNAIINFRQNEPAHIMENIIYNELIYRGYNVDVGIVEKNIKLDGVSKRIEYEADFVCNMSDKRIYIQSSYSLSDEQKYIQESNSLLNIKDSFKKIIITADNIYTHYTEDGILILRLDEFLSGCEI